MEKLGYGYDALKEKYPRLIYAAVSGFGHTGPYAKRPAYDMIVQAMGGVMSLTGHPGRPPTRVGTSTGDITAALFATIGVVTALYDREKTGRGQKVDVAMLDSQVAVLENAISRYVATGEVPGKLGSRHPSIAPFAAFATKDGHIAIAAGNDDIWARVCRVLGREDLIADERFRTNPSRVAACRCDGGGDGDVALREDLEGMARAAGSGRRALRPAEQRRRRDGRSAGAGPQHDRRNRSIPTSARSACRATRSNSPPTKTRKRAVPRRNWMAIGRRS